MLHPVKLFVAVLFLAIPLSLGCSDDKPALVDQEVPTEDEMKSYEESMNDSDGVSADEN